MKQNRVLSNPGTGASIVLIHIQLSSTFLLLFLRDKTVRYAKTGKVTAPPTLLTFHTCVSIDAKYQSSQSTHLLAKYTIYENS